MLDDDQDDEDQAEAELEPPNEGEPLMDPNGYDFSILWKAGLAIGVVVGGLIGGAVVWIASR